MSGLSLRQLCRDDAATLAALHALVFERSWPATAFRSLLGEPVCYGWFAVSVDRARAVGFVLARAVADEAEILTLAVTPQDRRRGIGAALLRATCGGAAYRGARRIFLEVAADNGPALALYRRHDFVEVGRRRAYYPGHSAGREAEDGLTLARPLDTRVDGGSADF